VGKGMVSKYAIDTALTVYNYNNTCANLKSEARERDNLISAYIDDGEEAKLYL
jgi:hypothetical protein